MSCDFFAETENPSLSSFEIRLSYKTALAELAEVAQRRVWPISGNALEGKGASRLAARRLMSQSRE